MSSGGDDDGDDTVMMTRQSETKAKAQSIQSVRSWWSRLLSFYTYTLGPFLCKGVPGTSDSGTQEAN